jgi:hypothetical protein
MEDKITITVSDNGFINCDKQNMTENDRESNCYSRKMTAATAYGVVTFLSLYMKRYVM